MFSGLNRVLKLILPKRLFYRALIIVAAPTIILQIIITIVFYDSVWIKVNKNTTRSLVAQLKTIEEVYKNDKNNLDFLTDSYKNNFNFEIGINQDIFPNISFLVKGVMSKNPIKSVAKPGIINSNAARAIAAPDINSYAGISFLIN